MGTVIELQYPLGDFKCPLADTENCASTKDGTYKNRDGLVKHIDRKHKSTIIWICSQCGFKRTGKSSYRKVKSHYLKTHAINTPETVQPSGSTELQILQNRQVKEYKNQTY